MAKRRSVWPWLLGGAAVAIGGLFLYSKLKKKQKASAAAAEYPYVPGSILPEVPGETASVLDDILRALGLTGGGQATTKATAAPPPAPRPKPAVYFEPTTPGKGYVPSAPIAYVAPSPAPRPVTHPIEYIHFPSLMPPEVMPKVDITVPPRKWPYIPQLTPATQSGGEYQLVAVLPGRRGGRAIIGEVEIKTPSKAAKQQARLK